MTGNNHNVRHVKGRFAPSPTGRMHLGNVFAAFISWLSAKVQGGCWLLRIEDLDPQRSHAEFAEMLMDDLLWLGLEWDEGPRVGGSCGPYWQSRRGDFYEEALQKLCQRGLVYPCTCTRADIMATQAPHESDGRVVYRGTCRPAETVVWKSVLAGNLDGGICHNAMGTDMPHPSMSAALRLMVPPQPLADVICADKHYGEVSVNLASHCGDFIVRRRDGAWAYQLAVVVDDALMGVTEVVRGRDLLLSAPQQMYVARLLGFDPPAFAHIPLLVNGQGQRLSKRDQSLDMGELRARYTSRQLLGKLAFLAGITEEEVPITAYELLQLFSWERVPHEDIVCSQNHST
ncbi:MAG: tRNA glutamyl-Q(34) synthetase GluQRS [Bacteroidaceae bacterium]